MYAGETLYNGIVLPETGSPCRKELTCAPLEEPPSLKSPPKVMPIAAPKGELCAEVLDENDKPIAPYPLDACELVSWDKAKLAVKWKAATDLSAIAGKNVKLSFHLKNGSLYSFWVSANANGASNGFVAEGRPGFTGPTERTGK